MKALVIEDRISMSQMFCGRLEKFGFETKVSTTVADAIEDVKTYQPQIVILDSSIENNSGFDFLTAVTPVEDEKESRKERRKKLESGPAILVVRTIYETVPTDCPFVKEVLVRPFSTEQLSESLRNMTKERKAEVPKLFEEIKVSNPEVELVRRGITYGESYVFFEDRPIYVQIVTQIFANAGYDMLLLTNKRPKVAREQFGLDKGAEVFTLNGYNYPIGTMIEVVSKFVSERNHPLIAIGDLYNIIEHCGVDLTLRAIQQILLLRKTKNVKFTLLVSVDGALLNENVRRLLTETMVEYKIKEE